MRSLSNLYKQWLVMTDDTNARVINSNAIMEQRMEKGMPLYQHGEPGAFMEGIVSDFGNDIKAEEEAEPEIDYVQLAKEEAERILAEAERQAEQLVNQAQAERQGIMETAKKQGYAAGEKQHQQEFEQLRMELETGYQQKNSQLNEEYLKKRETMENDLVDVILEVFNKVFHIQFDNKKDILMHLIEDAILNIEGEKKFRIRVAAENVPFLENHREEMLDCVGQTIEIEFLSDSTMDGNNCIIETDSGVFDCSLGVQLENLIKDIRSLCS